MNQFLFRLYYYEPNPHFNNDLEMIIIVPSPNTTPEQLDLANLKNNKGKIDVFSNFDKTSEENKTFTEILNTYIHERKISNNVTLYYIDEKLNSDFQKTTNLEEILNLTSKNELVDLIYEDFLYLKMVL